MENFLFSLFSTDDTNVLFITCSKLIECLINGKEHKILRVINLFQIENWSKVKGNSN